MFAASGRIACRTKPRPSSNSPASLSSLDLRVAVVGAGLIALEEHVPAWRAVPGCRVVALADPSSSALEEGERLGIARRVRDYRFLLDDPGVDVIDICAPTALHAEIALAALEAGKHVLCEKPLATTRADAELLVATAARAARKIMCVQQFRYDPRTTRLREFLAPDVLGEVYFVHAHWLRRRRLPGRAGFTARRLSGGGPLLDLGVHLVDLAWWLMGEPRPVSASGATFARLARRADLTSEWGQWDASTIDVEDFAAGMLRFSNGAALSVEASWLGFQHERDHVYLHWYGDRAGATWPGCRVFGERDGRPWDVQLAPPATGPKAHALLVRDFAEAIHRDLPVPIDPRGSALVVAMLEALYASAAAGREESIP